MSNTPGRPRQTHFHTTDKGEIELDLTDVVLPNNVPKPQQRGEVIDLVSRLPPEFAELLDATGKKKPKEATPEPKPKPRLLPFSMKPPSNVSRIISASKRSYTEELKEMARLHRWRDRVKRDREQHHSPSPPPEPVEVPKKRPREESNTYKPEQSNSDLMMELSMQHRQRMEEQERLERSRLAVPPT